MSIRAVIALRMQVGEMMDKMWAGCGEQGEEAQKRAERREFPAHPSKLRRTGVGPGSAAEPTGRWQDSHLITPVIV
jgi:hypothetical protein